MHPKCKLHGSKTRELDAKDLQILERNKASKLLAGSVVLVYLNYRAQIREMLNVRRIR